MKNVGLKNSTINDELYTPKEAILPLIDFLDKKWILWECCYGEGDLKKHFESCGFKVIGNKNQDFFETDLKCDVLDKNFCIFLFTIDLKKRRR
jgi:hypothetical protein